jgi:serine/threonine-protein kinase
MSPEQLRASATVDQRTDLWSLGATAYELLTGKLPFSEASDFAELVRQIVFGQPEPLAPRAPWAPAELIAIVERCLQRDLAKRYPDAAAMAADVARLLPGGDQITEAMLVPLSEAERVSVTAPAPAGPGAMGRASATAGAASAAVAVSSPTAGATAIMPAGAVPFGTTGASTAGAVLPGGASSPVSAPPGFTAPAHVPASMPAAVAGPFATGAPVVTGAPLTRAAPRRVSAFAAVALGLGLVGGSMGIWAIVSSRNAPSASPPPEPLPAPLTDAGADAPPPMAPDPRLAEKGDAGSADDSGAAAVASPGPPKTTLSRPATSGKMKADDPFGTNRQGK